MAVAEQVIPSAAVERCTGSAVLDVKINGRVTCVHVSPAHLVTVPPSAERMAEIVAAVTRLKGATIVEAVAA